MEDQMAISGLFVLVLGAILTVIILVVVGKASAPSVPEDITDADIMRLAQQGQKIQAIKWYRGLHGVGLKEAKEAVERMAPGL
jgi:large subunit ribosomal protein L7/L12